MIVFDIKVWQLKLFSLKRLFPLKNLPLLPIKNKIQKNIPYSLSSRWKFWDSICCQNKVKDQTCRLIAFQVRNCSDRATMYIVWGVWLRELKPLLSIESCTSLAHTDDIELVSLGRIFHTTYVLFLFVL